VDTFSASACDNGIFTVITFQGELDFASTDAAVQVCRQAVTREAPHLIFDFSGLTFMDSSGLNVLIETHRAVQKRHGTIALAGLTSSVRRTVAVTGFAQMFPIFPTVEEATSTKPVPLASYAPQARDAASDSSTRPPQTT
jgi:anti-sigma B factor antagonist